MILGKYMRELKQILVLDDTSDKIGVYNTKCKIKRYIKPKK